MNLRDARDRLEIEVAERTQQTSLLNLTHDSIFVRDMNDQVTYWNRGAQELYGWSAAEAVGKRTHDLLQTIFPGPLEEINAQLLRMGRWEGELIHTRADKSRVTVSSRWALRWDDQGRPAAVLETNNDITDRKRREEEIHGLNQELTKRSAELQATNKELEAFAYSVSHDLRAPLRHMAGYTELLQKAAAASLHDKGRRYIGTILDSAKRMGMLIDDLLSFSRIGRAETGDHGELGATRGAIVNVGSVVGLSPEYGSTVYGATKAFILFLSQSLHAELGPKGVYVQAVLPAATRTEIWGHAGKDVNKLPAVMEVDELVDAALAGFDRRETVTIPPLPDADQWTDFEAARKVMIPNFNQVHAAERYRSAA